jgi:hypothetical protein
VALNRRAFADLLAWAQSGAAVTVPLGDLGQERLDFCEALRAEMLKADGLDRPFCSEEQRQHSHQLPP